jgi:uncharacterized protein (TIGR00251 family)
MLKISEADRGIRFEVKVQPRASHTEIAGVLEGVLKVRLNSPPVDGKANQALINLLAKTLGIPKKDISIIRGETNPSKLIHIAGLNKEEFLKRAGLA